MSAFTSTLNCPQRPGIVRAVSSFLFEQERDIIEHQQSTTSRAGSCSSARPSNSTVVFS